MSPVPLVLLWQTPGGAELEAALHSKFSDRRTHGEWFDFAGGPEPTAAVRAAAEEIEGSRAALRTDSRRQSDSEYVRYVSWMLSPGGPIDTTFDEICQIEDPVTRSWACTQLLDEVQDMIVEMGRARRRAIVEMRNAGKTLAQIAAELELTPGRVSQIVNAEP